MQPTSSVLDGPGGSGAATATATIAGAILNSSYILLEHRFGGARLNTGMVHDLADLHHILIANFRTVRIAAPEPIPPKPGKSIFAKLHARRAEWRVVEDTKDGILRRLAERGHKFFSRLEAEPTGDGRLHVFLTDRDALVDLKEIAGAYGPGDPIKFDPDEFLRERLPECRWARELVGI